MRFAVVLIFRSLIFGLRALLAPKFQFKISENEPAKKGPLNALNWNLPFVIPIHPEDAASHHTPEFYIDDSRLDVGIKTFSNIVFDYNATK